MFLLLGVMFSAFASVSAGPSVSESVLVTRLSDGKELYAADPDRLLTPASVTKLATAAAALSKLGPTHQFETKVYYTGKRSGSLITGDLYIVGGGDPLLVSEKLWQLAFDIVNGGVTRITGDIVIDNRLLGVGARDASRQSGVRSSKAAYDAPLSSFGINFNSYAVAVTPATKAGAAGVVRVDPVPLNNVSLVNKTKTVQGSSSTVDVKRISKPGGKDVLVVTGAIGTRAEMQKVYASVGNHLTASGEYVRSFLNAAGVKCSGRIRSGSLPRSAQPLTTIKSYPLAFIVAGLNTFSNNYIADLLVSHLGSSSAKLTGSGIAEVESYLRKRCNVPGKFIMGNGSGLSTRNKFSARQLVTLLRCVEKDSRVFPDFIASLPAVGKDGTLRKRFQSNSLRKWHGVVHAKTGTLSSPISVAGLAGYYRHTTHGWVAFAMLHNGVLNKPQPSITSLRNRQDKLLGKMLNSR